DAIYEAIAMTDSAKGDDGAIRGVVVLTDGEANSGTWGLNGVINLLSRDERPMNTFRGFESDKSGVDDRGVVVEKKDMIGSSLAMTTNHPIHIFFVGIGKDADLQIGRMLSEATGAAFEGAAEKDLASIVEKFGKYF